MKLKEIKIEGFRKHYDTNILCEDATFLIGPNNVGKSSVLRAIQYLLEDIKKMSTDDYCCCLSEEGIKEQIVEEVVITGEFNNIKIEALHWRGFNIHRLFKNENFEEEGYSIFYRKRYKDNKCIIEMKQKKMSLKEDYEKCNTVQDYIEKGIDKAIFEEIFPGIKVNKKITSKELEVFKAEGVDIFFNINQDDEWFENPGGIPQNITSKLPKFLLISDKAHDGELSSDSGALKQTLKQLFEDVRNESDNFKMAQHYLEELAKELNPNDEKSEFALLLHDLNRVVGDVFPDTSFIANANLSNADEVIKPKFDVQLGSNIHTSIDNQGTGVVRSAIFAMLRYRSMRENKMKKNGEYIRPLLIAFEEPEIYLHPQAAKQMKDTIYSLSLEENNQIICTTHSPYMIDLDKETNQILNSFSIENRTVQYNNKNFLMERVNANPFNTSKAFQELISEDKDKIKMILKLDDTISKIFFVKNVLIVEGDTEEVVFKETLLRMPNELYKDFSYNWEIIKARGKASIISLVKYLKAMDITPYVIHDRDGNTPNAYKYNKSISEVLNSESHLYVLQECMEEFLGYNPSSNDKPYKAYKHINENWGETWDDVHPEWKIIIEDLSKN